MEKKSTKFILNSDWFLQRPIDMEHKEYILSSFLSKVEEALGRGEIYPYFTELSLHMASIGNYLKNGKYIVLKKEFSEIDDEIMLYDLKSKLCRKKFTESEKNELNNIINELLQLSYNEKKKTSQRCICYTKNNKQCKNKTFNKTLLCNLHNKNKN